MSANANSNADAGQVAIRLLNEIRWAFVNQRLKSDDREAAHRARTMPLRDVLEEFFIDYRNMRVLCDSAGADAERAIQKAMKAEDALEESKRPFTAQMEMQNRRIVYLNGQIDRLERVLRTARSVGFAASGIIGFARSELEGKIEELLIVEMQKIIDRIGQLAKEISDAGV